MQVWAGGREMTDLQSRGEKEEGAKVTDRKELRRCGWRSPGLGWRWAGGGGAVQAAVATRLILLALLQSLGGESDTCMPTAASLRRDRDLCR